MSLEFIRSTIDGHPKMPAGITVTCEETSEGVHVTFTRKNASANFRVASSEGEARDSGAFEAQLWPRIRDALNLVNAQLSPPKRKAKKAPKKKAKKRAKRVKLVDPKPGQQEALDETLNPMDPK